MNKIEIGELKIEVIGTEHYCTVCDKFTWKCYTLHRSGNLFILRVGASGENPILMLLSRGEFKEINSIEIKSVLGGHVKTKMSGTRVFSRGKITAAGWISFNSPIFIIEESDINTDNLRSDLTREEKELLNLLLDEFKLELLTKYLVALNEKSGHDLKYLHWLIDNMDLGVWTHLKPLLHTFLSDKTYFAGRAVLNFRPLSFKALFKIDDISFYVTKAKPKIYVISENLYEIELGQQRKIYVIDKKSVGPVAVYYRLHHVTYAHEQFKQHIHPTALISPSYFENYRDYLFNYRLGDILFIQTSHLDNAKETAALPEWIGKLRILQGHIVTDDKDYYVTNDDNVVAYHPEHGVLMIDPGTYRLERIQYLQAGHD
jgi:hypothetical protein